MGVGVSHHDQTDNAGGEEAENEKLHWGSRAFGRDYPWPLSPGTDGGGAHRPGRMRTIFINGKFTAQRTTGVQRSAACIVEAAGW